MQGPPDSGETLSVIVQKMGIISERANNVTRVFCSQVPNLHGTTGPGWIGAMRCTWYDEVKYTSTPLTLLTSSRPAKTKWVGSGDLVFGVWVKKKNKILFLHVDRLDQIDSC